MGNQSDVNIDAVAKFGTNVDLNIIPDFALGTMAQFSKVGAALVGATGTNEAQTFRDWYMRGICEPLGEHYLTDARDGLQAHADVAIIIAANYRHGDISQGQEMDAVNNAFNPTDGQESIRSDQAQNPDSQPVTTDKDQLPKGKKAPAGPPPKDSPQQQVNEHNQKYGQNEHWQPEDPNQPYDPPIAVGPT